MRAIDFSCRLLLNVYGDDMSVAQWLVLLCVMSGVETSEGLSKFCGRSLSTCINLLRMLEAKGYVRKVTEKSDVFLTTASGRERVRNLLSFISDGK